MAFPGAPSNTYNLIVKSAAVGTLDTSSVTIKTEGKVTSISPSSGSTFGGTLVTISGETFSTTATDNNVQIGGADCIVESTMAT